MIKRIQNNMLAGLLAVIPVLLTLWIVGILIEFLIAAGTPPVRAVAAWMRRFAPEAADVVLETWFQRVLAVAIVLFALYLLGALTKAFLGRRLIAAFDAVMGRIPLVKTIYGAARKLIDSFQSAPAGVQQRVVLIDFPSEKMKAVGLVTRTFTAADTGEELAAVYVPTTPNPTSGYLEIVPIQNLVWLDWTTNEAMQFVMSGGAVSPERINYGRAGSIAGPAVPRPASH